MGPPRLSGRTAGVYEVAARVENGNRQSSLAVAVDRELPCVLPARLERQRLDVDRDDEVERGARLHAGGAADLELLLDLDGLPSCSSFAPSRTGCPSESTSSRRQRWRVFD